MRRESHDRVESQESKAKSQDEDDVRSLEAANGSECSFAQTTQGTGLIDLLEDCGVHVAPPFGVQGPVHIYSTVAATARLS